MTRTLRLSRETLATLTDDELSGVAAGTQTWECPSFPCTGYGCPPWAFETLPLRECLPISS